MSRCRICDLVPPLEGLEDCATCLEGTTSRAWDLDTWREAIDLEWTLASMERATCSEDSSNARWARIGRSMSPELWAAALGAAQGDAWINRELPARCRGRAWLGLIAHALDVAAFWTEPVEPFDRYRIQEHRAWSLSVAFGVSLEDIAWKIPSRGGWVWDEE